MTTPPAAFSLLYTYGPWKHGVPLVPGALGEQSAWWLEAMDCLDVIFQSMQEKPRD